MLAVWFDATGVVVIVKVPVVAPAAIVAVPVTVAAVLLEVTVIGRPPAGAGLLIVIVPVEVAPPETEVGFSERVATVGAVRAKFAFADDALELAVMFAVAFAGPVGAGGFGSGFSLLLPVLMIGVVYLMMIRPQQKKQKLWAQMLSDLKTGDRITTTGGIRGTIISLKDDALIMRVAPDGIKMEVVKSAIASVTTQEEGSK